MPATSRGPGCESPAAAAGRAKLVCSAPQPRLDLTPPHATLHAPATRAPWWCAAPPPPRPRTPPQTRRPRCSRCPPPPHSSPARRRHTWRPARAAPGCRRQPAATAPPPRQCPAPRACRGRRARQRRRRRRPAAVPRRARARRRGRARASARWRRCMEPQSRTARAFPAAKNREVRAATETPRPRRVKWNEALHPSIHINTPTHTRAGSPPTPTRACCHSESMHASMKSSKAATADCCASWMAVTLIISCTWRGRVQGCGGAGVESCRGSMNWGG